MKKGGCCRSPFDFVDDIGVNGTMVKRLHPTQTKASPRPTRKVRPPVPTDGDTRAVIRALEEIDAARADLRWCEDDIWAACTRSAKLRKAWKAFKDEGGVTAEDFRAFLKGHKLRGCTRQKKHLRVIADNTGNRRRQTSNVSSGPSAA